MSESALCPLFICEGRSRPHVFLVCEVQPSVGYLYMFGSGRADTYGSEVTGYASAVAVPVELYCDWRTSWSVGYVFTLVT